MRKRKYCVLKHVLLGIILWVCFLAIGSVFSKTVIAQEINAPEEKFFLLRIAPQTRIISENGELELNLIFDAENPYADYFVLKPVSFDVMTEIYDIDRGKWIPANAQWSDMPNIKPNMQVKISGINTDSFELGFQIQDLMTAKIYETENLRFWGNGSYAEYIKKVNANLKNYFTETTANSESAKIT